MLTPQSKVKAIRNNYRNVRQLAMNEELSKVKFEDLKRYKKETEQQLKNMESRGQFQYLQQVDFYGQKFQQHIDIVKDAVNRKLKWREITPEVRQIYKDETFVKRNSYLIKSEDPQANKSPKKQNAMVSTFFEEKRSKIVPQVGFKSLLENPPIANTNFKKRINNNNQEIKRLRAENDELRSKIGGNLSMQDKRFYEEKLMRFEKQMGELQSENRRLLRENQSLKSQGPSVAGTSYTKLTLQEQLYAPYFIQTQQNDLYKINVRNQSEAGYSNVDPFDQQDYMRDFQRDYDTYSQPIHNQDANQTYSVFDMTKSYFPQANSILESSRLGIQDPQTIYRNKASFFKPTGILVRNDQLQIGYKRSALDRTLSRQKIILYFNNKSRDDKRLQVFYDYESQYYNIEVKQKVKNVNGFRQAREVVEVELQKNKNDLNSLIDVIIKIGNQTIKLWLPSMFIDFRKKNFAGNGFLSSKVVKAARGFNNPRDIRKILSEFDGDGNEGSVWGISRVFQGPINLRWKSEDKLEIKTSKEWIDYLGFILHYYQQ